MNEQPPPDSPADPFEVRHEVVESLVASYEDAGATSLEDVFPAALVAPAWRALLKAKAIAAPEGVDLSHVEVRLLGPDRLEVTVPFGDGSVHAVAVRVTGPGAATAGFDTRVSHVAQGLASALTAARAQATFDFKLRLGSGQKPHG